LRYIEENDTGKSYGEPARKNTTRCIQHADGRASSVWFTWHGESVVRVQLMCSKRVSERDESKGNVVTKKYESSIKVQFIEEE